MDYVMHNLGGLACLLILVVGGVAFWRGLSVKTSEPGSRPPDRSINGGMGGGA
jgi:hypothetical protein